MPRKIVVCVDANGHRAFGTCCPYVHAYIALREYVKADQILHPRKLDVLHLITRCSAHLFCTSAVNMVSVCELNVAM